MTGDILFPDSLVGYWPLDNTSLEDFSTNGNDGAENGTLDHTVGKVAGSLRFDKTDSVSVPSQVIGSDGNREPRTASAWVYIPDLSDIRSVFSGGTGQFYIPVTGQKRIRFHPDTSNFADSQEQLDENQWHHIAVAWDENSYEIYLDGVQQGVTNVHGDPSNKALSIESNLNFGGDYQGDGILRFLGRIDDVRIHDVKLSQTKIQIIKRYGERSSTNNLYEGLVGYWPLDSLDVKDNSAYDNHGIINGGITAATGKTGDALEFDGNNGTYIELTDSAARFTDESFTLCAWVYRNNDSSRFGIFSTYNDDDSEGYIFRIKSSSDANKGELFMGNDSTSTSEIEVGTYPANEWLHIAVVADQENGEVRFYKNGVLEGTDATNILEMSDTTPTATTIGNRGISNTKTDLANGRIDDVRAYRRKLSQSEIQQIVNQRARQVQRL